MISKSLGNALRDDWVIKVIIPMMVKLLVDFIPGTLVVYSLPLPLQIPIFHGF
ncbi:MAG: hypothetical protein U0Z26_06955 [Anaerolineales bacterium]